MVASNSFTDEPGNGASHGHVVHVSSVSRHFGPKAALDDVSISIAPGTVLGLVGENGAGKTTLIKHVLGLLRAQSGSVRVFNQDPVRRPVAVLQRLGYLSEENDLPVWMRVEELLRYVAAFYPNWDERYAQQLRREFDLDPRAKIKQLSKGQKARVGLVAALAYRPELLVLDEPSSGLDPVVRRDILGAIIRTIADEGRTVLFSSHLLSEVERVSDRVAMIKSGRILFCDSIDNIRLTHTRLTLRFDTPRSAPPAIDEALIWEGSGTEWTGLFAGSIDHVRQRAGEMGADVVAQTCPTLDEIFLARTQRSRTAPVREAAGV